MITKYIIIIGAIVGIIAGTFAIILNLKKICKKIRKAKENITKKVKKWFIPDRSWEVIVEKSKNKKIFKFKFYPKNQSDIHGGMIFAFDNQRSYTQRSYVDKIEIICPGKKKRIIENTEQFIEQFDVIGFYLYKRVKVKVGWTNVYERKPTYETFILPLGLLNLKNYFKKIYQ